MPSLVIGTCLGELKKNLLFPPCALALGYAKTTLSFSTLIKIDPIDGTAKGKQSSHVLTYKPRFLDLEMPSVVIGTGLGEFKKSLPFPHCALALGYTKTTLSFSTLIGIDHVDGTTKGKQSTPFLTHKPHSLELKIPSLVIGMGLGELKSNSLELKIPSLVIGMGLGELKSNLLFPPCAHKGVNHQDFYKECPSPACHFVAKQYVHLDMLNDDTNGVRRKATYCLCTNEKTRKPMRNFVGGFLISC